MGRGSPIPPPGDVHPSDCLQRAEAHVEVVWADSGRVHFQCEEEDHGDPEGVQVYQIVRDHAEVVVEGRVEFGTPQKTCSRHRDFYRLLQAVV